MQKKELIDGIWRNEIYIDYLNWKRTVNEKNRFDYNHFLLQLLKANKLLFETEIPIKKSFYRGRFFNIDEVVEYDRQGIPHFEISPKSGFEGYSADKCGAPPTELATEGRLNSVGVPFLYTCEDEKTVIYELRPIKKELISIAEFVTNKKMKFADCTSEVYKKIETENFELSNLLLFISSDFSHPHYQGHKYWFTQFLAGQFINMGFDGVVFNSSLIDTGKNYVFFNPNDCTAINSKLCRVRKIQIQFDNINRQDLL